MGLKLMAELGLDGTGFQAGFNRAKGAAHGFASGLKSVIVQAVGIATVEQALAKTVETANELYEASERLAIAPKNLQVLRQAAKDSHVEFEKLVETFEKLDVARERALSPGKEGQKAQRAFHAAGIDMGMLRSDTASQLFMGPLSQLAKNRNPEEIGVIFRELGVKGFGKLIPALKTDFDALGKKMEGMGAIMDTQTIVKIKAVGEEFSLLSQIMVSQLGPALIKLAEALYENALKLGKNVAGAAGFFGAATATRSPLEAAGGLLKTAGFAAADIYARVFKGRTAAESKAYLEGKLLGMGFDVKAGREGATKAESPFDKRIKEFEALMKKFQERAKDLDHPKPPDFSKATISPGLRKKALETPSDSLVKIGNFLGAGRETIGHLATQTRYLSEIAKNTRRGAGSGAHPGGHRRSVSLLMGDFTNHPAI